MLFFFECVFCVCLTLLESLSHCNEVVISRFCGGIYYRLAVVLGLLQGRRLGGFVDGCLKMKLDDLEDFGGQEDN